MHANTLPVWRFQVMYINTVSSGDEHNLEDKIFSLTYNNRNTSFRRLYHKVVSRICYIIENTAFTYIVNLSIQYA